MRLINIEELKDGMVLAKPVFNENGVIILREGAPLKEKYKGKLRELGYNNIYIQDELLRDLELSEVVSEEIKRESINNLKETFAEVEKRTTINENIGEIKNTVNNLVDELISNRHLMINMVDLKMFNQYTFQHSVNVAILSLIVGIAMGLNQLQLYKLGMGALLHDIGKTGIRSSLLEKEGELTQDEYEEIKTHCKKGYEILKENKDIPTTSAIVALHHHERYDGDGYPEGKSKDDIHLFCRITAVADVYDALISKRPYRQPFSSAEAMEFILGGAGINFDREIVQYFFRKVATYPEGTKVRLSDGRQALVIKNFEKFSLRPMVRVIKENGRDVAPYDIDLREEKFNSVTIVETQ